MQPTPYRITVRGALGPRFAGAFQGLTPHARHGETALVGEVRDQSHLYAMLERARSLGLELVSVAPLPESPTGPFGERETERMA